MQLSDKIAEMIENGILPADLKLPSIRQMSALLNVNSVTIVSCYKHLETKGYVYSRPGSGTYVAVVLPKQSEITQTATLYWMSFIKATTST